MKEVRVALVTIYCDERSHAHQAVGPLLTGHWVDTIESLSRFASDEPRSGLFLVTQMERRVIRATGVEQPWMPVDEMPAPGYRWIRPRRGGGLQWLPIDQSVVADGDLPYARRFHVDCDWCGLSYTRQWGPFAETLDELRLAGVSAVSLRSLIDATKRRRGRD